MLTLLRLFALSLLLLGVSGLPRRDSTSKQVLILGGGVAGVIAARTLHENGIQDFLIIEARNELGGRMKSRTFGGNTTVELGANWVQGTQTDGGPANPIFELAKKHNIKTQFNDYFGSVSQWFFFIVMHTVGLLIAEASATYDHTGAVDFLDVFNDSIDDYNTLTVSGGLFQINWDSGN